MRLNDSTLAVAETKSGIKCCVFALCLAVGG